MSQYDRRLRGPAYGTIAAHPQSADYLSSLIKCDAAAECNNAAGHFGVFIWSQAGERRAVQRALRLEVGIEGVRIVQAIKRTAGLGRRIKISG